MVLPAELARRWPERWKRAQLCGDHEFRHQDETSAEAGPSVGSRERAYRDFGERNEPVYLHTSPVVDAVVVNAPRGLDNGCAS